MLLPMDQISRADVAPVHGAMDGRVWVVLKEDVIATVDAAEPVRVVHPSLHWPDMQRREAGIGHGRNVPDLGFSSIARQ